MTDRSPTGSRAQSETIGVLLLTGVVIILIGIVGVVVVGGVDTTEEPRLDLGVTATTETVTITHRGGDAVTTGDLRVVLQGDEATRSFTVDAANVTGEDGTFSFADAFYGLHELGDESMRVRVVHVPSNTIVADERVDLDPPRYSVVFAVNSGGSAYTTDSGVPFQADTSCMDSGGLTYSTSDSIDGTTNDTLYQSECFGDFGYTPSVANGTYRVTFKLAEIYWTDDDRRLYNVSLEGRRVVTLLDIHSRVGHDRSLELTRRVTVTDGTLDIEFVTETDNAKSSAILVERIE
jgi:FlaG/FlaF family flagellin (archaellin)